MLIFLAQSTQPTQIHEFFNNTLENTIAQVLAGVLIAIGPLAAQLFLKKSAESTAAAKASNLNSGVILLDHLKSFLYSAAASIAETRFPKLARDVVDGKINTPTEIKQELYSWGDDLKGQAVDYFQKQGVDIVKQIGNEGIDTMIQHAANEVSPFPGKDTAAVMTNPENAKKLLENGIDAVKQTPDDFKVDFNNISL